MRQAGHIKQKGNRFSWKARFKSFGYAFKGLSVFFKYEHNTWIHLSATVLVVFLAIVLKVSSTEAIALSLSVGFVWVAELFNTAIEHTMDLISNEKDPQIKVIKDISAAAVLLSALAALITGCIIFTPKIF
jgi:diacylglycerol kinase